MRRSWQKGAITALCLFLLVARRTSTISHPQLWAEDATVFYRDQLVVGWAALVQPYAGYLHLASRVVAALGSVFSAQWIPLFYNSSALLLAAICCSEFARKRYRVLLANDALRYILCAAMAAAFPSYELIGNLANLQWFIVVGAIPFAMTLEHPVSHGNGRSPEMFLGLFLALSAPALVVLLPVLLWRARSALKDVPALSLGLTAGLTVQTVVFLRTGRLGHGGSGFLEHIGNMIKTTLVALSNQVILPTLFGQRHAFSLVTKGSGYFGMLTITAFIVFIAMLGFSLPKDERGRLAAAVWFAAGSVVLSMVTRPSVRQLLPDFGHAIRFGADRYFFCGCCLFAYCLALAAKRWMRIDASDRKRPAAFACLFILGTMVNFHIGPLADLKWAAYASSIDEWSKCKKAGVGKAALSVPVNPEPWRLDLPALGLKRSSASGW